MEIAVLWLFFAVLVGMYAAKIGRSGLGWFLLAALISPLLAFLLCLVLGPIKANPATGIPSQETRVKCPDCRELILQDARVCKHCGAKLTPTELPLPIQMAARAPAKSLGQVWQRNKAILIVLALIGVLAVAAMTR